MQKLDKIYDIISKKDKKPTPRNVRRLGETLVRIGALMANDCIKCRKNHKGVSLPSLLTNDMGTPVQRTLASASHLVAQLVLNEE